MKNIGSTDRLIRIVLGIALLVLLAVGPSPLRFVGILGIVLLGTAATRTCPLYMPFKINTDK
jgi:hypothetical protein